MRGEFIGIWSETWREIWLPLIDQSPGDDYGAAPDDVFCELYRTLAGDPKRPGALRETPSVENLADILDDPVQSREAFEGVTAADLADERAIVGFFESAHDALEELGGDELTNHYFLLLSGFIDKFSLRYDLRRPCTLCPTLPGLFSSLLRSLTLLGDNDENVARRLRDFREALQDLRLGQSVGRFSNCVTKQVMLLEAIASASGCSGSDLRALAASIVDWPHPAVRSSLLNLYGFTSDFPGMRHGTPSTGMTREVNLRDLIAVSVLLAGFTPYLSGSLDAEVMYRGA